MEDSQIAITDELFYQEEEHLFPELEIPEIFKTVSSKNNSAYFLSEQCQHQFIFLWQKYMNRPSHV